MSTKEKTYTFRAAEDLAPRARDAFHTWQQLLESGDALPSPALERALSAFCLAVARRARAFDEFDNQSALIRTMSELFVEATEKVADDLRFTEAYLEWAQEDADATAIRRGALAAAAERWRDE